MIITICVGVFSFLSSKIAYTAKQSRDAKKAYACGEEFDGHMIQPDYSQFFPFAFYFTILHVVALVIATVPIESIEVFTIAVIYVISALIGLFILLRRHV